MSPSISSRSPCDLSMPTSITRTSHSTLLTPNTQDGQQQRQERGKERRGPIEWTREQPRAHIAEVSRRENKQDHVIGGKWDASKRYIYDVGEIPDILRQGMKVEVSKRREVRCFEWSVDPKRNSPGKGTRNAHMPMTTSRKIPKSMSANF